MYLKVFNNSRFQTLATEVLDRNIEVVKKTPIY